MSELKSRLLGRTMNEYGCDTEIYLKSEADKLIAELKEKLDDLRYTIAVLRKDRSHGKYKRCLAMAEACMHKRWRPDEGFDYARSTRHMKKWL